MIINSIEIENLRNHIHSTIELSPQMNIFCGANGAGKTTILEAISYAGISKSFLPASDFLILNNTQNYFLITAKCTNDIGNNYQITLKYTKEQKSRLILLLVIIFSQRYNWNNPCCHFKSGF